MNLRALLYLVLLPACLPSGAAEPAPEATNAVAPTNSVPTPATNAAPTEPLTADQLAVFRALQLRPGYRLQLAAADPAVHSPVALAFDASGRLFVAEQPADASAPGVIKLLEDADGDGTFEKVRVYADNVMQPTALICYSGGVFVASGSKIAFLADTTGKGVADLRREVFGGFDTSTTNGYGGGINNFTWGLDNRIHAANAGTGGKIFGLANRSDNLLTLDGFDFAFDPRTLAMAIETGGASRGVGFDNAGRRYTATATRPVQFTLCDPIRATRNPFFLWPKLSANLAPPNAALSRLASSLLVYRGGALGTGAVDEVFFTDPAAGTVSRLHLRENGFAPMLELPRLETNATFLSSREATFRPVQIISGPDGSIYVADLAREKLDAVGENGGRIWRISPANLKSQKPPSLPAFKSPELVNFLASPNAWMRDTSARLLFERRDTNVVPLLAKQLTRAKDPLARLQILYTLAGLDALKVADLIAALRDVDPRVREHAVQLAEDFARHGNVPDALWSQLTNTPEDPDLRVRFQAAFTVGTLNRQGAPVVLADLVRNAPAERALQLAVLSATGYDADRVFINLVGDKRFRSTPAGWGFLRELAVMAGQRKSFGMDDVLTAIERAQLNTLDSLTLARCVGEGLAATGHTFADAAPRGAWHGFGQGALNYALANNTTELRAESVRFLGVSGYTVQDVGDWLLAFLVSGELPAVQSAAINSLSRFQAPAITTAFIQRWPSLSATSQREIIAALLERPDRTFALLNALDQKKIPLTAFSDSQVNFLRTHRDNGLASRAERLFGPRLPTRLAERFAEVAQMNGSAARGREVFNARCVGCHAIAGNGGTFGPDLEFVTRDRSKLLQDILEPDREIQPAWKTGVIQRSGGQILFGLTSQSGPDVLLLRQPDHPPQFFPRANADDPILQDWSMMPEDAAAGLTAAQLADLLEFIAPAQ